MSRSGFGGGFQLKVTSGTLDFPLQAAYNDGSVIELDSTNNAVQIRDSSNGLGGNLFVVENSDGSEKYLTIQSGSVSISGTLEPGSDNTFTLGTNSASWTELHMTGSAFFKETTTPSSSSNRGALYTKMFQVIQNCST